MYFNYIDENLEEIKNPNDVDVIKLIKGENGYSLYARINKGDKIQLTLPQRGISLPNCPLKYLSQELGRFYFDEFAVISGSIAINKNHLTQLEYIDESLIDNRSKRVELYARFDDGNYIFLSNPLKRHFMKEWKIKIEQMCGRRFVDTTQEFIEKYGINR